MYRFKDASRRAEQVPPRRRGVTPARVVALAVIAVLVGWLASIGMRGDGRISVPAGAKAGDLTLVSCTYPTEEGSYRAECGTLVVPEDRADPGSRLIAVPVTVIHARSADPGEPIFRLEGGPGVSNMTFLAASRLAEDHDVVLVGYRGVDGSERLDCPEVGSAIAHSADRLGEGSFRAYADAFRACADRLSGDGIDVTRYGLVQQVDDLETARVALGYDRIDLLSESAGTRTAMIYAWRYPESIHRSVMIGVNPPGNYVWDGETTDEQLARYATLCSRDADCSARTADLVASIRRTNADLPDRWLFLPIDQANVRIVSFLSLMESTSNASPATGPMAIDAWLSAAEGDESGLWFASVAGDLLLSDMFVWGQYAAAGSIDGQVAVERLSVPPSERDANLGTAAASFVWGGGQLSDAWPVSAEAEEYQQVRTSEVETLVISGELDFSTPPQVTTEELMPYLPNGHQVVLPGFGHTVSFWTEQADAGTHLMTTFFDTGAVDDSRYHAQRVDLSPGTTDPMLGKIVAGSIAGLAIVAVLSLLWMAGHVRRRGGFGRTSSAVLRTVFPAVLGLGGWSLGVLFLLTTVPSVPLLGMLVAIPAGGLPVALGVYLAWVKSGWSSSAKVAGFLAATAGALGGAWLGFLAGSGAVAALSGILGAILGANLLVVLLDVAGSQSDRPVPPTVIDDRVPERVGA
jgi:pimeloyl-ACP methyl ester carboxylesterase